VGAGRIPTDNGAPVQLPSNFRLINVTGPTENIGLRKLGIQPSRTKAGTWDIFVAVKNYGSTVRSAPLVVGFGGAAIGSHRFTLQPGAEDTVTFQYPTRKAGWVEARLLVREPFGLDDRALLELPSRELLPVDIYSDNAGALKTIFTAIPGLQPNFLPAAKYTPNGNARIVVLDRFGPSTPPSADTIWIEPPMGRSPISIRSGAEKVKLARWRSEHSLAAGLHTKDLELERASFLRTDPDDITVAESDAGPLIAARPGKPKNLVIGFNPVLSNMKYELATPLLFANVIRWMAPEVFTTYEVNAGTVGTITATLENEAAPSAVKVVTADNRPLPFTVEGRSVRFFSGSPGIVRVSNGDRELVYSLTLPQAGDLVWKPTGVKTGIPRRTDFTPASRDIWQWLAVLGAIGLALDWFLFGRGTRMLSRDSAASRRMLWRKAS
jgi:hypothetical protein